MRITTVFDIRELIRHIRQGESDRAIRDALGLSRNTIAKYRAWAEEHSLLMGPLPSLAELETRLKATQSPAPKQATSKVEPHRVIVEDLRCRGLECQAIYQRLREAHDYTGSYSAVWRFVAKLEGQTPDVTVRVEVGPGEEAQVDFGYAGQMYDPHQKKVRRAWAFVMTLSHSRHQYVEFVFDQTVTTWTGLHRQAFEFFGGVPKKIKLDNLKAAIIKACFEDPQVQRAYRECAEHYGFLISPCRVATLQHKGKVENGVHYLKRNFLAGRDYTAPHHNVHQASQDVLTWVRQTAGLRKHGTTKQQPLVVFNTVEQATLLLLPYTPFDIVLWKEAKLHRDCYIVFEGAYYSAPFRFVGQTLWIRGTARSVEIQANFERIAIHSRVSAGQRQTVLTHLPPQKVEGLTLTPIVCIERALAVGPSTYDVVQQLLRERPIDRLPAAHRLLKLAEGDHSPRLERACARALAHDDVSFRTVTSIFQSGLAETNPAAPLSPAADWPKFARPVEELIPNLTQKGDDHASANPITA